MQRLSLILLLIGGSLLLPSPLRYATAAQADEKAAVLATVNAFFNALAAGDRTALQAITLPDSLNISTAPTASGDSNLTVRNHAQLLSALSRPERKAIERYWDETVLIHGDIAVFWAPYDFHVDGAFSHCGIDSFQLVKQNGKWMLSNMSWTIEPEGCAPSPLGPLQ